MSMDENSLPIPFFWSAYFDMIERDRFRTGPRRRFLLWGGRSLGKTTFLRHVKQSLLEEEGVELIGDTAGQEIPSDECSAMLAHFEVEPGRAADSSRITRQLTEVAEQRSRNTDNDGCKLILLIDDLDRMIDANAVEVLTKHLGEGPTATTWTIGMSRVPPSSLIELGWRHAASTSPYRSLWSDLIVTHQSIPWRPWSDDHWMERGKTFVTEALAPSGLNNERVQGWCAAVAELTGGHPLLVGSVLQEINRLVGALRSRPDSMLESERRLLTSDQVDHEDIREHLEDHLVNSGDVDNLLRRSEEYFRWSDEAAKRNIAHRAFDTLIEMARARGYQQHLEASDPEIRQLLIASGLVYRLDAGDLVIAGDLLRRALLNKRRDPVDDEPFRVKVHIEPEQGDEAQRGRLVLLGSRPAAPIALSGSAWRVLRSMVKRRTGIKVEEISDDLNMSKPAVRSAIQRLTLALRKGGLLQEVIESERTTGYRVAEEPIFDPRRVEKPEH
ncbi:MAG: ATP-binding protein [Proteobacteria bacterium]|nr:ATP-binding protein [Pseudomonadota bacterium]